MVPLKYTHLKVATIRHVAFLCFLCSINESANLIVNSVVDVAEVHFHFRIALQYQDSRGSRYDRFSREL